MTRRYLRMVLLLAAAARFALLAAAWNHPQRLFVPDSYEYVELGYHVAEDNAFRRGGQAEIFRTPGYPLFLVPSLILSRDYWRVAIVAQVLLDVLLVYLTFIMASMLAGERVGLWAAVFQAISTVSIASSLRIGSDGLYAVLLTLAICLMIHHLRTAKYWSLVSSAGVLAAACYVRPVGIVMAVIFVGAVLFKPGRLRRAAAFLAVVLGAISPWVVRNYVAARYVGFSSFAGDAMYFFAVPELKSRLEDDDPAAVRAILRARAGPIPDAGGALPPPGPAAARRRREALETIAAHPFTYAGVHLRGCFGAYLPGAPAVLELMGLTEGQRGTSDVLRREGLLAAARYYFGENVRAIALAAVMVVVLAIKYLAVAAHVIKRARLRMPAEAWLAVVIVIVCTLLPGPFALPRYRVPFEPLLSVAAAAGMVVIIDALRRRRGRRLAKSP
ncbi:MAG: hypothetical protein ACYTF6_02250 [Planctomycetota bacterium]